MECLINIARVAVSYININLRLNMNCNIILGNKKIIQSRNKNYIIYKLILYQ